MMRYILIFLGFSLVMSYVIHDAYGLWIPLSPEELTENSKTIFVGTITEIKFVEVEYQSQISRDGTIKEDVGPEIMTLEEYTIDVQEFLKNPQDSTTMQVLRATVGEVPSGPARISGFEIGDRVLFYLPKQVEQTHFYGQYLPESFKIPQQCDAKTVLKQPKIEGRNSFTVFQNDIAIKDNFTAGIPMNFVYSKDKDTLYGRGFDVTVSIKKEGNDQVDFEKKIHAELEPCQWIASAKWDFTPEERNYQMYLNIRETEESGGDTSYTGFSVISEPKISTSPQIENINDQLFYVIGPFTLRAQSEDTVSLEGVKFSYPYYPVPIPPGGVQTVDISFEDGTREHIGTVGPPNPFLKFTGHKDPIAGVRRNSDGTFNFLVSVNPQSISPLKQFTSGIKFDEIQCRENLVLVQKYDGSPACVKPETKITLIERGWTEKNQIKKTTATPFCKQPLYVLDLETNTCTTNEELSKCTDNTSVDSSIQNCRVSVTCDKEFDPSMTDIDMALLPECKPVRECPEGFLFAIFPVDGGDALCEREERNMHFGIFHPLDQRMLNSTDLDFSQEETFAKPVDLNGSEEERTIQIIVIMSGWYEELGSPIAKIESNSEQIEQLSLDLQKNQPGQAIHGFDYVLPESLPDGKITLTIDMPGYDTGPPQTFQVSHIPK